MKRNRIAVINKLGGNFYFVRFVSIEEGLLLAAFTFAFILVINIGLLGLSLIISLIAPLFKGLEGKPDVGKKVGLILIAVLIGLIIIAAFLVEFHIL